MATARTLTAGMIAWHATNAGFTGQDIQIAVAVALAESSGNTFAHNNKPPDNSFGLWQINMLGTMGANRRQQFGISTNESLFDPAINAKAAFAIKSGRGSWSDWSTYTNGKYRTYMNKAAFAATKPEPDDNKDHPGGGDPGLFPDVGVQVQQDPVTAVFTTVISFFINLIKPLVLRVAGFVGGGVLIIIAIIIYIKSQT